MATLDEQVAWWTKQAARLLESQYLEARYPDAAQGVPYELFQDSDSHDHLQAAEEVQKWVLQQLAQQP